MYPVTQLNRATAMSLELVTCVLLVINPLEQIHLLLPNIINDAGQTVTLSMGSHV